MLHVTNELTADHVQVPSSLTKLILHEWADNRNLYTGNDTDAFSTVNPICIDYLTHTHEMAHNLG